MATKSTRTSDPRRLDVLALAEQQAGLQGAWALTDMVRLVDSVMVAHQVDDKVVWQAQGEARPVTGGADEIWLHVTAKTSLALCCQRCLGPVYESLDVDRWLRFVRDEAEADRLDEEQEDDVLVLEPSVDLRDLIEDELLLALPLVPRHEVCPQTLPRTAGEADVEAGPHPFAVLGKLLGGTK